MTQSPPSAQPPRWRATLWTVLVLLLIARLTLTPSRQSTEYPSFFCILGCGNQSLRDLLSNILLFIPLGWVLSYWLKPRPALAVCLLLTVAIETLQGVSIPGRDSSFRDILANTAGGGLGIWLYPRWGVIRWPGRRRGLHLALGSGLVVLLVLTLSGIGVAPQGSDLPWFGQWTPDLANFAPYRGTLLDVRLSGERPSRAQLREPVRLRQSMREGNPQVTAQVVSGPPPSGLAVIFGVTDSTRAVQLFLLQGRTILVFQVRTRFESWGLRELQVRLPFFPGRSAGDSASIEAGVSARRLTLLSRSGGREDMATLPLTVGLGWLTMLPFRLPVYLEWVLFNPIWLAGLVVPVGYWAGRSRPRVAPGLLALLLLSGLGGVPYLTSAAPTTGPEWIGAVIGAVLGWSTGVYSRRRVAPAED